MIKTNVSAIIRKEKIKVKRVIAKANKAIIQPNIIAKNPVTMEPPYTANSTPRITIPAGIVILGVLLAVYGGSIVTGFFAIMFGWMIALFAFAITLFTLIFSFLIMALTFVLIIFAVLLSGIFGLLFI